VDKIHWSLLRIACIRRNTLIQCLFSNRSIYIYIYIYTYVCVCVCVCVHTHICLELPHWNKFSEVLSHQHTKWNVCSALQRLSLHLTSRIGVSSDVDTCWIYTHDIPCCHIKLQWQRAADSSELHHCMADPMRTLYFMQLPWKLQITYRNQGLVFACICASVVWYVIFVCIV